jgi:hypothetical protein
MHSHFLRAVFIRGSLFDVLREKEGSGDPTGGNAEEALIPPRGKQVPLAAINGQTLCLKTTIYAKRALIKRLIKMFDKAIILGRNMILSRINGQ